MHENKKCNQNNDSYHIIQINEDNSDEFLVWLHPIGGDYKDQNHILTFKTMNFLSNFILPSVFYESFIE